MFEMPQRQFYLLLAGVLLSGYVAAGETVVSVEKSDVAGFERFFKISPDIFTGSEPLQEDSFKALQKLGIKTIVSVDGAKPDVEKAKACGLKYVHVPYGYENVPDESQKALARVISEREGPFYFHCHHGRHRGPAAAAIALRLKSGADGAAAQKVLEGCGTGSEYKGIWKAVADFTPPEKNAKLPELHEITPVEDMAGEMAKMDRTLDHLVILQKNGWKTPPDHADLSPEHEAKIMSQSFQAVMKLKERTKYDEKFWDEMKKAETFSTILQASVKTGQPSTADQYFRAIQKSCIDCHKSYRNNAKKSP
jgi:protein tyrosine phosphatase (PTP) superfamily phosphohydrolase (DUF442 family)